MGRHAREESQMSEAVILTSIDRRGVATVTLNRPGVNNAYNRDVIAGLAEAFGRLEDDPAVRLVVLRGNGKHFQAGADLAFLREAAAMPETENLAVSRLTVATIAALQRHKKPTLALVHGGCFGGGVGMVAACDMAIASEDAVFSLTEVRWGLTPAPILPALIAKIGLGRIGRYGLTAERFPAAEAHRLGLVDALCPTGGLDAAASPIIENLLLAAPEAVAATKRLAHEIAATALDAAMAERLAQEAAARRRSPEAAEGLASFFEKRHPRWYPAPQ
jgi:methylglutaconyl-CoA hydratase